jgi:hypothetical protein
MTRQIIAFIPPIEAKVYDMIALLLLRLPLRLDIVRAITTYRPSEGDNPFFCRFVTEREYAKAKIVGHHPTPHGGPYFGHDLREIDATLRRRNAVTIMTEQGIADLRKEKYGVQVIKATLPAPKGSPQSPRTVPGPMIANLNLFLGDVHVAVDQLTHWLHTRLAA